MYSRNLTFLKIKYLQNIDFLYDSSLGIFANHVKERSRRSLKSRDITIEMAVYTDAAYTQTMLVTDFSKRLQHILLKYHAVSCVVSSARLHLIDIVSALGSFCTKINKDENDNANQIESGS